MTLSPDEVPAIPVTEDIIRGARLVFYRAHLASRMCSSRGGSFTDGLRRELYFVNAPPEIRRIIGGWYPRRPKGWQKEMGRGRYTCAAITAFEEWLAASKAAADKAAGGDRHTLRYFGPGGRKAHDELYGR